MNISCNWPIRITAGSRYSTGLSLSRDMQSGETKAVVVNLRFAPKIRFAPDSPLEESGFELPVPLAKESVSPAERVVPQRRKGQSRRNRQLVDLGQPDFR